MLNSFLYQNSRLDDLLLNSTTSTSNRNQNATNSDIAVSARQEEAAMRELDEDMKSRTCAKMLADTEKKFQTS